MTRKSFLLKKQFWLTLLKCLFLVFVGNMVLIQIPELRYDFGPEQPLEISELEELTSERFSKTTFASIQGIPNFEKAFIYQRYGLNYTYFIIEPYGMRLVARTYDEVTDDWKNISSFMGKLRPFNKQPFSYRIRQIYKDRFQEEVPEDAFFLALYDVPEPNGWQIGAVIFSSVLWLISFYFFFIRRHRIGESK
jgi:hypothetical protein